MTYKLMPLCWIKIRHNNFSEYLQLEILYDDIQNNLSDISVFQGCGVCDMALPPHL